jgi:hypothetical protein
MSDKLAWFNQTFCCPLQNALQARVFIQESLREFNERFVDNNTVSREERPKVLGGEVAKLPRQKVKAKLAKKNANKIVKTTSVVKPGNVVNPTLEEPKKSAPAASKGAMRRARRVENARARERKQLQRKEDAEVIRKINRLRLETEISRKKTVEYQLKGAVSRSSSEEEWLTVVRSKRRQCKTSPSSSSSAAQSVGGSQSDVSTLRPSVKSTYRTGSDSSFTTARSYNSAPMNFDDQVRHYATRAINRRLNAEIIPDRVVRNNYD